MFKGPVNFVRISKVPITQVPTDLTVNEGIFLGFAQLSFAFYSTLVSSAQ